MIWLLAAITLCLKCQSKTFVPAPLVLWHGMGDSCCDGIGRLEQAAKELFPGLVTYSMMMGNSETEDRRAGYFGQIPDQVEVLCQRVSEMPEMKNGFTGIGFSQGGLFLRGYVQFCQSGPPMLNLITLGTPHAGTSDVPECTQKSAQCTLMKSLVKRGVYLGWIQKKIIQAQYFKKWDDLDAYFSSNIFLPRFNQEERFKNANPEYKRRLNQLEKFVLIRFDEDDIIKPRDSAWFWFYDEHGKLLTGNNTESYKTLGLDQLEKDGKLEFLSLPGNHMNINEEQFKELLLKVLLPSNRKHNNIYHEKALVGVSQDSNPKLLTFQS